jgi:dienelactone hydrolase
VNQIAYRLLISVTLSLISFITFASESFTESKITFPTAKSVDNSDSDEIDATLRVPNGNDKRPAVVILHTSGGDDGTGKAYAIALTHAGFVTLEPDWGRGKGTPNRFLPHTFGALQYLAKLPRVDAKRIGGMGFSLGGILNIRAATEYYTQKFTGGQQKYAAHIGLYPVCWAHLAAQQGKSNIKELNGVYNKVSGAPVHILAGAIDEYDEPDTCNKFLDSLPPDSRKHFSLTVYPDAGHGWDTPENRTYYDGMACLRKGCNVNHFRVEARAQESVQFAVKFFTEHLKP